MNDDNMTDKNNKKRKKNTSGSEYTNVILEEMNDNIKILAEGQGAIRDDLADFKKETRRNFKSLSQELADFKVDTKQNFDLVFKYLSGIEDELASVKRELEGIKDGSIPVKNIVGNTARIAVLEQQVADLMAGKVPA